MPVIADVVIAGGGFAGAATAYHLALRGVRDIVLLEAEELFGEHASGLNAAMARQVVEDELTGTLLMESVANISRITDVEQRQCGSLLLVQGEDPLCRTARQLIKSGLNCSISDRTEALKLVPALEGSHFPYAIITQSDSVVDIHALLWHYLHGARMAGATLMTSCPVIDIEIKNRRLIGVRTPYGVIRCRVFVNAAGAWANKVASLAGLDALPMTPYKRHIAVTPPLHLVDRNWPFVWHVMAQFYFRPEGGGLLLSPCDQTPAEPGRAMRDPSALEDLAQKLAEHAPALADVPIRTYWAGLRTIASDHRFVIGFDPRCEGFFWVAALGGHGMTGSYSIGSIAAELITSKRGGTFASALSPERFL